MNNDFYQRHIEPRLINTLAYILSRPAIAERVIKLAQRTPYFHLNGYMNRYWLVPYSDPNAGVGCGVPVTDDLKAHIIRWFQRRGIAIRVHHILRHDNAKHMHNHPWDARTIILRGWYVELRPFDLANYFFEHYVRRVGDTATLKHTDVHHISEVSRGGAWTLFITREYQHSWGFLVDGRIVPWREYEGRN